MIRMLGMILIAGGCFWLGEQKSRKLRARTAVLTGLLAALRQLEQELRLHLSALPVLLDKVSRQADPLVQPLFEESVKALEQLREVSFSDAWPRLVDQLPALNEQDRSILASLGPVLGRYDGRGQGDTIAGTAQELKRQLEQAQEAYHRLGRVYRAVGAAGGGFLIILLL